MYLVNVGINTDAPRVKLDVRGTVYARQFSLGNTDPTLTGGRFFSLKSFPSKAANQKIFQIDNNTEEIFSINNQGLSFAKRNAIGAHANLSNAIGLVDIRSALNYTDVGVLFSIANSQTWAFQINNNGSFKTKGNYTANENMVMFSIENIDRKVFQVNNNGLVQAREIKVDLAAWPDYVFKPTYNLMPLVQVEAFIKTFKHLPNVLDAKTVETDGINLGEMSKLSFEKIEELTLYAIEQNKMIETLKILLEAQNKRIESLEKQSKN